MAKDKIKAKAKVKPLASRFSVMPLVDKGEEFLCIDANWNFVVVKKTRLEQYSELALPETYQEELFREAMKKASEYLPSDSKKVDNLVYRLKQKGVTGFEEELNKALASG